jgi:hypothetical protein
MVDRHSSHTSTRGQYIRFPIYLRRDKFISRMASTSCRQDMHPSSPGMLALGMGRSKTRWDEGRTRLVCLEFPSEGDTTLLGEG